MEEQEDNNNTEQPVKKKRGNAAWVKGVSGNLNGRPKVARPPEQTNRSLREKNLLELLRKFRPIQTKAVQAAVKILDNEEANDANKIKASALVLTMYRDLIKEVYNKDYDEEEAEAIQEDTRPVFSLKMINAEDTGT